MFWEGCRVTFSPGGADERDVNISAVDAKGRCLFSAYIPKKISAEPHAEVFLLAFGSLGREIRLSLHRPSIPIVKRLRRVHPFVGRKK